jgi:hypothetical protein
MKIRKLCLSIIMIVSIVALMSVSVFANEYNQKKCESKFDLYESLLGLDMDSVAKILKEKPIKVEDDDGYYFKEEKIIVHTTNFYDSLVVWQIFSTDKNFSYNGVKIGDPLSKCIEKFGEQRFINVKGNKVYVEFGGENYYFDVIIDKTTEKILNFYICYSPDGARG